jgi:3-hydroxyethyl bacteriochlorophyllide a dehydrogenase
MDTVAVVLREPEQITLSRVELVPPTRDDIVVDVAWSGISTGTERLLWTGGMPPFPGMGYPLVPGYESVGRVVEAGPDSGIAPDSTVFVPGARCFTEVRSLFGASAQRLVVPGKRAVVIDPHLRETGILMALAATAHHAIVAPGATPPERIVGHGVLGRLIARLVMALGHPAPVVWERNAQRREGATGYEVCDPCQDKGHDYRAVVDASGNAKLLDNLIGRLARGGEVVLAGFYAEPLTFAFPPAFMREARLRIAAEWQPSDLAAVKALVESGALSLGGLITHTQPARAAPAAYRIAFDDPACFKMVLDWSGRA